MVRLMMVRHAQSKQNAFQEQLAQRVAYGRIPVQEVNQAMRDGDPGDAETGGGADSSLSPLGMQQATALGKAWAPLLASSAKKGKLRVFVSPFKRTLQTADPLMCELKLLVGRSVEAVLLPAIMERGGLVTPADMKRLDATDSLMKQGKRKEAIELFKSLVWEPMGFTGDSIHAEFQWARFANDSESELLGPEVRTFIPARDSWWTQGYEGTNASERRVAGVVRAVQERLQPSLGDDEIVVFVSHGEFIEMVSNMLARGSPSSTSLPADNRKGLNMAVAPNTGITVFHLPSPRYKWGSGGERPNPRGKIEKYRARLELYNDTAHLGFSLVRGYAQARLGAQLSRL